MEELLVVFSHGKESGPWGSKICALAKVAKRHTRQVISVNYREHPDGTVHDQDATGEAERRIAQLLATPLPEHQKLILVGSSMGGYVSTLSSQQLVVDGLFLMAPAFYFPGYLHQNPAPHAAQTLIVHGWCDTIVPVEHSIRFSRQHLCALHLLDGDHRLNDALPQIEPLFELFIQSVLAIK